MLKNGIILTLRKLKAHATTAVVFLLGQSIAFIGFLIAVYNYNWLDATGFTLLIIVITNFGIPFIQERDLRLYKIFGASFKSIIPLLLGQALTVGGITTLLSTAILGIIPRDHLNALYFMYTPKFEWVVLFSSAFLIIITFFIFLRLFLKSDARHLSN